MFFQYYSVCSEDKLIVHRTLAGLATTEGTDVFSVLLGMLGG